MLDPWEGLVYNALVIAFGIGVWRSAHGSRALRAIGGLQILSGAIFPLWLLFGEASLTAHLVLAVVGILMWLGSMGLGAAAFGRGLRLYSLISLAAVVTFNALAITYAPEWMQGNQHRGSGYTSASPSAPTSCGCRWLPWLCGAGGRSCQSMSC
jgi:hypothetical protein